MFERLFNQPIDVWREATWVFESGWPLIGLFMVAAIILAFLFFSSLRQSISTGRKVAVLALQSIVVLTALTMLWRPALEVSLTEQGENAVAWLFDSSSSMEIADVGDVSRRQDMLDALQGNDLLDASTFQHDLYRFGSQLEPVDTLSALTDDTVNEKTNIAGSLNGLLDDLNKTTLAAIVLVSDGADNAGGMDATWWQAVSSAGIPIHTIGVGSEVVQDDLEIRNVSMPSQSHVDADIVATVVVRHAGTNVARLRVSAGRELLAAVDLDLPSGQDESTHTVEFNAGSAGVRRIEFSIDSPMSETNTDNNRLPRMLDVQDDARRILYVEGEPRWEYKFLRRAVHDNDAVQLVSLLRTSPNKFYRQGVANADELSEGFPDTVEKLFAYDAVIIGSLEAAELSTEQQAALRDFVSVRGGTLLMLAGRKGLADGGWARSVTAAALPVELDRALDAETYQRTRAKVRPTLAGLRTPWLELDTEAQSNREAWETLPEIADNQSLGTPKPGAVVLLEVLDSNGSNARPLLVWQRYGRGNSAVMGSSGTWRWQMRLNSEDQRHEKFWQGLLKQLVQDTTPRLSVSTDSPIIRDSDSAELNLLAYNADFSTVDQNALSVEITRPDGGKEIVSVRRLDDQRGHFVGSIPTTIDGPYAIKVSSPIEGEAPSAAPVTRESWIFRESGNAERYRTELNRDFLERLATTTGGQYLPLDRISELPAILVNENAALKRESRLPLWNMPAFFLLLLLAKGIEWLLRLKWKRL